MISLPPGRICGPARPMFGGKIVSERNYASYDSPQGESRSRSRRPSESRRNRPRKKRSFGRTVIWAVGTLLLVAIVTGSIMCCFAAVYIRNTILPKSEMDLSTFSLSENSVMYYQDSSGQYQELGQVLTSILKQGDRAVYEIVSSHVRGNFRGGEIVTYTLADKGVGITDFRSFAAGEGNKLPPRLASRLTELRRELERQAIRLPSLRQGTLCNCR